MATKPRRIEHSGAAPRRQALAIAPRLVQREAPATAPASLGIAPEYNKRPSSKQRDLFAVLTPAERQAFLEKCKELHFQPGGRLFLQNDIYSASYLIKSGNVRTFYVSPTGKEITIAHWSEGAMVGGPNVFDEQSVHIWSAAAMTEVTAYTIRGRDLEELSTRIPAISRYLIDTLTFKLQWVSLLLQTFGTESVRMRLAHLLLQLGRHYGNEHNGGIMVRHLISHEELARMVGATRSWVSLTLSSFKKEGILTCEGRYLVILDSRKLEQVVIESR